MAELGSMSTGLQSERDGQEVIEFESAPAHPSSPGASCSPSSCQSTQSMAATSGDTIAEPGSMSQSVKRFSLRFCPRRPLYGGNSEALGWALDAVGRSVSFIAAAVFVGTALLNLAKKEAGCETEPPEGETKVPECNNRVHGIRPSSLLTTYSLVVGLASAALLPLMGAIMDYTPHRRAVGRTSAVVFCTLLVPMIFVSETTWFAVAIITTVVAFVGWVHTSVAFAYLPEMTDDSDTLINYTANFTVMQYSSMVVFLIVMVGMFAMTGLSDDDVASARIAQTVSVLITTSVYGYTWRKLFRERPAAQKLPEGGNLLTAGFKKVYHTTVDICRNYKALKWFFLAVSLSEAALQSLGTIAITYMTDQLQFTSTENGIAILVLMLSSIPGTLASTYATKKFNPIRSEQLCLVLFAVTIAFAALVLTGPGQQVPTYLFASGWGVCTGWKYTTDRFMTCMIIPKGQDAELMGMYLFAGQVLTWFPPLVFTAMNEAGVSMRMSIASINFFVLGSVAVYCLMGNYDDAVRRANRIAEGEGNGDDTSVQRDLCTNEANPTEVEVVI